MKKSVIKIGLLSHLFAHENLGCVALSISNILFLDKAAIQSGIAVEYVILVSNEQMQIKLDCTENNYSYRIIPRFRQSLLHPIYFLRGEFISDLDIMINLSGGDGFTDIYGFKRVLGETYMTLLAGKMKIPTIFAPQTIGPFESKIPSRIAAKTLEYCDLVFSRDNQSTICCKELNAGSKTTEVIDVAFALPYHDINLHSLKKKLGVNVSGLLYNGGYNRNNYFNLNIDYKEFTERLIEEMLLLDYEVHLIPHVNAEKNIIEDDYRVCEELHRKMPNTILAPRYSSPVDVKSYIAKMDFFTGARMHSTIAAFSSQVPVVPIAYSRKFSGLYGTLEYKYIIDLKVIKTIGDAVAKFKEFLEGCDEMKKALENGRQIYNSRLNNYENKLADYFKQYIK